MEAFPLRSYHWISGGAIWGAIAMHFEEDLFEEELVAFWIEGYSKVRHSGKDHF